MLKKTEYVLETVGSAKRHFSFRCSPDSPRGERIDSLSEMLTFEIGEAKIDAEKKRKESQQFKESI